MTKIDFNVKWLILTTINKILLHGEVDRKSLYQIKGIIEEEIIATMRYNENVLETINIPEISKENKNGK
jgi:hypothetical protein